LGRFDARLMVDVFFRGRLIDMVDAFVSGEGVPQVLLFSWGERFSKKNAVADTARFAAFLNDPLAKGGFTLKSDTLVIGLDRIWRNPSEPGVFSVSALGIKKRPHAEAFFEQLLAFSPLFGFCCTWDEYWVRNNIWQVKHESGDNGSSSFLGRDLRRYIPGLYWRTVISAELAAGHGVDLEAVGALTPGHRRLPDARPGHGLHVFSFGDDPLGHRTDDAASRICKATPGFFHIDMVKPDWIAARTWREWSEVESRFP
jgi:hypothetical protein